LQPAVALVTAAAADSEPAGHAQSLQDLDLPDEVNCPAAHDSHSSAPAAAAKRPGAQSPHAAPPVVARNWPGPHVLHVLPGSEDCPTPHAKQSDANTDAAGADCPALQSSHAAAPLFKKRPAAHAVMHAVALLLLLEKRPTAHASHAVVPLPDLWRPGMHAVHASAQMHL
jgi:hypothetical protein